MGLLIWRGLELLALALPIPSMLVNLWLLARDCLDMLDIMELGETCEPGVVAEGTLGEARG